MKTFKDLIDEKLTPADLEENYKKHSGLANLYDKEMKYFKDKDDRKKMATSAIKAHTRAHTTAPNDAKKEYHKKRIEQYNSILKESEELEEGSAFDKNMNDRARNSLHKLKEPVSKSVTLKVGDYAIYNKGKTAETVGKVHKIDGDDYILHHQATNTLHRVPKNKTELHESEELSEARIKPLPRRHFFDTYGNNNGIAYTDNKNWWKIMNGKVVGYANSYEDTSDWKKEFVAIQKGVKESEELDEAMTPQQKMDFERMMKGAMSRDAYNAKWKKPLKSAAKVIYGKNMKESEELDEAMVDSWKKVQSMDKGSVLGNKEQVKKRLDYLKAVHAHHKKYGNDTKKVRADIEKINRSRLAEETEELEEAIGYALSSANANAEYARKSSGYKGEHKETVKPADYSEKYKRLKKKATEAGHHYGAGIVGTTMHHYSSTMDHKQLKSFVKESVEIDEAAQSGNKGNGYHGQFPEDQADAKFSAMHTKLKKKFGEEGHLKDVKKPNVMIKHFLDSTHGRHVAAEGDSTVVSRFKNFKRNYKPELHEAEELEEGKHEGTIAAIAKHAYSPEVGHKIVTKKGGQVPGTVEKIEKDHVYFRHPEGKLFRTHVSNVQKDGKQVKESEEIEEGIVKDLKRLASGKDAKSRAGEEIKKSQQASMSNDNKTAKKHFTRFDKLDKLANGVKESEELSEMDKSAPQPGKDGKVSLKTYGSRDGQDDFKGPEKEAKPITFAKAKKDALAILNKQANKK